MRQGREEGALVGGGNPATAVSDSEAVGDFARPEGRHAQAVTFDDGSRWQAAALPGAGTAITGVSAGPVAYQPMQLFLSGAASGPAEDTTSGAALARGYRKGREGYVVSDKMDKTVVVQVEDHVKHPKYGKVLRRTKKYKAHDATNACGVGDRVLLMETRPLSATKRWRVAEILEKAK